MKKFGYKIGDYPISENFYKKEVSLPIYPDLSNDDVELIIAKILEIISE